MKHLRIYSLPILLSLAACQGIERVPETSLVSELTVKTEQMQTTRAVDPNEKKEFELNDEIHIFGFFKPAASTERSNVRFMPDVVNYGDASGAGLTFKYMDSQSVASRGHRFGRTKTDATTEMGFWQIGQYHDFTAYYLPPYISKPMGTEEEILFEMDQSGLQPGELLWGESLNWIYRGDSEVKPVINFKHQLSRIRVELIHDMDEITAGNFIITGLDIQLSKQQASFNVAEGSWTAGTGSVTLTKEVNIPLEDVPFATLKTITDNDWWVLPGCSIGTFTLYFVNGKNENGEDNETLTEVIFNHNDFPNTPPITRKGYVTVLRLHINDIRSIIFTATLQGWEEVNSGENIIIIDDENKMKDDDE